MKNHYNMESHNNVISCCIKDKTVVVTGGAQGIGFNIAEKFLEHGAKEIIILDIEVDTGMAAANELNSKYGENRTVFIKCDVTKDIEKVSSEILTTFKTVDVLVNNAGAIKEDSIRATFDLYILAVVKWSMKFFEYMRTDKGGSGGTIMNMSSIFGVHCEPYAPYYTAAKHAVIGFTKSKGHAMTFAVTGVRMVAICPGFTRTRLLQLGLENIVDVEFERYLMESTWQNPDDVGNAAIEIYEKADSGTTWIINGGTLTLCK